MMSLNPDVCRSIVESPRWLDKVRVDPTTGCHIWTGAKTHGHARIGIGRLAYFAHRISLVAHLGRDLDGQVDHLCRNRACVNPAHLEEVDNQTNTARGKALVTHCPRGHELSGDNLVPGRLKRDGHRVCRECERQRSKAKSKAVLAAAHALGMSRDAYMKMRRTSVTLAAIREAE